MIEDKSVQEMLNMLDVMLDEDAAYPQRLEAYEFLMEDCEAILCRRRRYGQNAYGSACALQGK